MRGSGVRVTQAAPLLFNDLDENRDPNFRCILVLKANLKATGIWFDCFRPGLGSQQFVHLCGGGFLKFRNNGAEPTAPAGVMRTYAGDHEIAWVAVQRSSMPC